MHNWPQDRVPQKENDPSESFAHVHATIESSIDGIKPNSLLYIFEIAAKQPAFMMYCYLVARNTLLCCIGSQKQARGSNHRPKELGIM